MSRIIINNLTDASDLESIALVEAVMHGGRISNQGRQYCYVTAFKSGRKVSTHRTKAGTDTFTIYGEQPTTEENEPT